MYQNDVLGAARRDERIEGRKEGLEQASLQIAHKMLKAGADPALIKEVTGLEPEII